MASDGPLRILFVVHGFPPECRGGTELYVLAAAKALAASGFEVAVLAGSLEGRPTVTVESTEFEGLRVHRLHRSGLFHDDWSKSAAPEVIDAFLDILAREAPDLVHVHHWVRLSRRLVRAASEAGLPVVVTLHDQMSSCPRCFRVRDETLCTRPASGAQCTGCVPREAWQSDQEVHEEVELYRDEFLAELGAARRRVVPSFAQQSLIVQTTGLSPDAFTVVPHGAITSLTRLRPPPSPKIRLGHWGHLYPMKGLHLLLEALHALPEATRARFRVEVFGECHDAAYWRRLEALAQGLDLQFLGAFTQADLARLEIDWAVLPSLAYETFAFVLDEAFALGVPAIVARRGALPERLAGAGLAFEPENSAALAEVLAKVAAEPALAAECARKIPELESMADHGASLGALYREVFAERAVPLPRDRRLELRAESRASRALEDRSYALRVAEGRLAQLADRARGLESRVREAEASVEEAKAATRRRDAEYEALVQARDEHQRRLETSIEAFREALERRNSEYEVLAEARDTNQKGLETSIAQLRELLAQRDAELAALERRREGELAAAERRFDEEASARRGEAANASERIARAAAEVDRANAAVEAADQRCEGLVDRVLALEDEVVAVRTRVAGLDAAHADAQQLLLERAAALEAAAARIADLEGRSAALELRRVELEALLVEVQGQGGELERRVIERERRLSEAEQRVVRLEQSLNGARRTIAELEIALGGAEDRLVEAIARRAASDAVATTRDVAVRESSGILEEALAKLGRAQGAGIIEPIHRLPDLAAELRDAADIARGLVLELRVTAERSAAEVATLSERVQRSESSRSVVVAAARRAAVGLGAPGPLRIVMVVHQFVPRHAAGSEIYTWKLARALVAAGHQVHLVFTEAHPGVPSYVVREDRYDGLPFTEISHQHTTEWFERTWRDPRMASLFGAVLDRVQPDVVHFQHTHYLGIEVLHAAKERGLPIVYTLHEYLLLCPRGGQMLREDFERCRRPVEEKCAECIRHLALGPPPDDDGVPSLGSRIGRHLPPALKSLVRAVLPAPVPAGSAPTIRPADLGPWRHAIRHRLEVLKEALAEVDLFVSPSRFLRRVFADSGLVRPERILVSDNGMDLSPFASFARRPGPGVLRVGYIGTIAEYKGLHVLVEALNRFVGDGRIEGHIHGSMTTFEGYAADLVRRSRNPATTFHGRYDNARVGEVLAGIDVLVVPSLWWENSPLTIHEAFLAGIPVVASDIGGMAEFVVHGRNGLLFTCGDPDSLEARLRELLDDPALFVRLAAERTAVKSIEEDAAATVDRYRSLIAGRAVPGEEREACAS